MPRTRSVWYTVSARSRLSERFDADDPDESAKPSMLTRNLGLARRSAAIRATSIRSAGVSDLLAVPNRIGPSAANSACTPAGEAFGGIGGAGTGGLLRGALLGVSAP